MKKTIFLVMLFAPFVLFGEETYTTESAHYNIVSHVSRSNSEMRAEQLESFYDIFNEVFRFNDLENKLNVEILPNLSTFKSYTLSLKYPHDSYVYMHSKGEPEESRLLIYEGTEDDMIFALAYQASIQFIMNHAFPPPLWVREGFSVYFSKSSGPELEKRFATLKNKENRKSLKELVAIDSVNKEEFADFRTESWAFVTFLMATQNREYTRFLWDTINSLKNPSIESARVNADIQNGYNAYLEDFLTPQELMELGIRYYTEKEEDSDLKALEAFTQLAASSPESWQPFYFLGLLAYDKSDYVNADIWYDKAAEKGATEALIAYVTGLTAWKDKRIDEAKGLLAKASRLDGEKYGEKTGPILDYLQRTSPEVIPLTIP